MDPYRPNLYAYRPPGGHNSYGGPRPGGFTPHQRPFGNQTLQSYNNPRPLSVRPAAQAPHESGKLTTLFVGAIAAGVNDVWIERFLKACGSLRHWKRVMDQAGKPKGFGFAEYEDPDSVLRALRVLGGEGQEGVTLTAMDGTDTKKKLIANDNVRNHLEQYQKTRTKTEADTEADQKALETIQELVQALQDGRDPDAPAREQTDEDMLSKELAVFKDRAVKRDQEKTRRDQDRSRERWPEHESSRRRGDRFAPRQDFHRGATEQLSEPEGYVEDDEENERRRQEQHEKDVLAAFQLREKRYEHRESNRLRNYHRDIQREEEDNERERTSREYWAQRLAEWDDDVEMDRGTQEFYVSRSRWRKAREDVKRREEERDDEDRRAEQHEIDEAKRRAEEEERVRRENKFLNREPDEITKIEIKPRKLNFNLPIKRVPNMGGNEEEEDEEEGGKRKRVLVPLDYGDDMTIDGSSHLDPEERAQRVKELIGSIPSSEQELWNWPVKWNELDEDLVSTKLHPFVSKKIVEIVGVQEDDLVDFILEFIRNKKPPTELVSELEMTLDEEALMFVMKLWRALIFETERKFQRL
ncbi:hypothetical protein CLU79DRAFT_833589 [Phycomyces nitens]|nr:hypothetical protein CLU79DRAFT_833589 [Phycomyces nitens]